MAPDAAMLTVVRGEDAGRSWQLRPPQTYRIGRSSKSGIPLNDATVSAVHATITYADGIWFIVDNNSKHGTFLNGEQALGKRGIFDGDVIRIGNTYLRGTYTMRNLPLGPELRKKEKKMRAQAIKYLKRAQKKGQFTIEELPRAMYLIGELYRRNERFRTAIKYYENALKIKNRPLWLEEWINEQMAKAYAEYAD